MKWNRQKLLALLEKIMSSTADTNLRKIAIRAEIPYDTLFSFWQGKTNMLRVENLDKILEKYDSQFAGADGSTVDIVGTVNETGAASLYDNTARGEALKQAPCPTGFSPLTTKALLVEQDIISTIINAGSLIYYTTDPSAQIKLLQDVWQVADNDEPPTDDPYSPLLKRLCVLRVKDKGMMFCRLMRGYSKDRYNLKLFNGKDVEDAQVEWAARVISITM